MAAEREPYRKLPGQRRGILRGASLWMGSDHLLSVKSLRFREEYKRFHLADVQAIVVARGPRFHLSTRSMGIACLWLIVFLSTRSPWPWMSAVMGSAAVCLVGAWVYACYARSCRCRIYTAVSREELPSIYRTWTARKFLEEVEPRIREVQGVLPSDWAEAIESHEFGPGANIPRSASPSQEVPDADAAALSTLPAVPGIESESGAALHSRTAVTDVFVGSLFADALLNVATLHSLTQTVQWIWYALAFVQVGGAILIFMQHYRRILTAGMQKLAVATLIAMGASYYLRQVMEGVSRAGRPGLTDPAALTGMPGYVVLREVDVAVCLVLGIVGVVVALKGREDGADSA